MSKIGDLLARRRRLQLAGKSTTTEDALIAAAQERCRMTPVRRATRGCGLFFNSHARRRMAQRGITVREVYAVWLYGERRRLQDRRIAHVVTREAISSAPERESRILRKRAGMAILVDPAPKPGLKPVLVTVLADGSDTYFSWFCSTAVLQLEHGGAKDRGESLLGRDRAALSLRSRARAQNRARPMYA